MISGIPSRTLNLLLIFACAAAQAGSEETEPVAAFLATLAPPQEGAIPFVERRMSALLMEPIVVRGELRISKDGAIDKRVSLPAEERVRITARTLTLERRGKTRTVNLAGDARWRAFHAGIVGLMNRDAAALNRVFAVRLHQRAGDWILELRPRVSGGKRGVTLITAAGTRATLLSLRLDEGEGEWQEMTFPPAGP